MLKHSILQIIIFFAYSQICNSQEVTILKTDHVFVYNSANKELVPTDLNIYWIIDRNKNEIRIVKERSVDVIKLDELKPDIELKCGYLRKYYTSDHVEVEGFIITYILNSESNKLSFIRLQSIKEKEKVFFISEEKNEDLMKTWVKCISSN